MELKIDLVLHSKSNGVTTISDPRARQHPTALDWQRWAPTIAAHYNSVPARVLIGKMNANGLLVTEKMFRDRLRQWGMNHKNRRDASKSKGRAFPSANNKDKASRAGSCYTRTYRGSAHPTILDHEKIQNALITPKEELVLQRTLKGILDWQRHAEDSTVELDYSFDNVRTFVNLVSDINQCLYVSAKNPFSCEKITSQLRRMSAELRNHLGVICTPPAVLYSVDFLSHFAFKRNSNPWYYETSRFFINAAVEAFPDSHPSLLVLRLVFNNLTPSQLVMMYEVGSSAIEQCYGEATAFFFRVGMHSAASRIGLGATIRSYADELCAATPDATKSRRLFDTARLYYWMGQNEKSADALQRYLAKTEDEDGGDGSTSIHALWFLAAVQSEQNDFVGEEVTLQKILKITQAMDRRGLHTSQLGIDALDAISELDRFYVDHGFKEQRDALHREYPSVFEL